LGTQNNNQARGRQRRLERLLADSRLSAPKANIRPMHLRLALAGRSGDLVLRSYDLQVGYQDEGRPLFRAPDLVLKRGECVAIIGPNGAGKTTFLKTILNQIPPYAGRIELGASLKVGYFAQAHEGLNPELTLIEEINTVAPAMLPAEARNYLAKYGFTGEEVFAAVSTLSGGERGRLALAKLALTDANLLLLDEPTNHPELPTLEVLQNVQVITRHHPVGHPRPLPDNALATQIGEVNRTRHAQGVFRHVYRVQKAHSAAVQPVPETAVPVHSLRRAAGVAPPAENAQPQPAPANPKETECSREGFTPWSAESAATKQICQPPQTPSKTAQLAEATKTKRRLEPILRGEALQPAWKDRSEKPAVPRRSPQR
jgi:ATP-binding cassette subfamily F protein 3